MTEKSPAAFSLKIDLQENFPLVRIEGYFSREAGAELNERLDDLLKKGQRHIAVDFTPCGPVNSLGVAAVMKAAMKVVEDFHGYLVIIGIDELKWTLFEMAGIFSLADSAKNLTDAERLMKEKISRV